MTTKLLRSKPTKLFFGVETVPMFRTSHDLSSLFSGIGYVVVAHASPTFNIDTQVIKPGIPIVLSPQCAFCNN